MVARRRVEFGYNELPEKYVHPLVKFLMYFTLPMPIMIWVAIIIELIKAIVTGEGWEDFIVLMILQFANGTVGFIEERNAGNAVAALKAKLTPECYVCRAAARMEPEGGVCVCVCVCVRVCVCVSVCVHVCEFPYTLRTHAECTNTTC